MKASDELLDKLIAIRSSVARELMQWVGKVVTLSWAAGRHSVMGINWSRVECEVLEVSQFFVTFKQIPGGKQRSEPLKWVDLSWDDVNKRLRVFVNPERASLE